MPFNDYQKPLGSDLSAVGGGGTGDQFYAGKAAIYGLELEMSNCFTPVIAKFQVPVSLYGKWLGILTGCKYRLLIFS